VIALDRVRLERRTREEHAQDLKARLFALITGRYRSPRRKLVLDDITLAIDRGEKIGIIGPNGAGKSTLLKVICGVLEPSAGSVRVDGRVAPMLELGAGFDPDLTVVDNIVLYGVLLGVPRRAIIERIEAILAFAELEDYRTFPVRALSSGMMARLGFAIATDIPAEILLVDEALSVGDESFRARSRERIDSLWHEDRTIVLVSHDLATVRSICTRTIWLAHGRVMADGPTNEVVSAYVRSVDETAIALLLRARG
jgi:ABC-type polysaccharide/polyol phosphate transport system ATPase subunit